MSSESVALVSFPEPANDYDLGSTIDDILFDVSRHEKVQAILKEKGSLGGYLCIAREEDGLPLAVILFGDMPREKCEGRLEFSQEKAKRLASHPDHKTSWESRDPANNKWGGAIRGKKYIISVSGLPEELDEVVSALFAYAINDLDVEDAKAFLAANDNEYYKAKLLPDHEFWAEAA